MRAESQVGVDPVLEGRQVELLEPGCLTAGEGIRGELGERRPAPELERFGERFTRSCRVALREQPATGSGAFLEAP